MANSQYGSTARRVTRCTLYIIILLACVLQLCGASGGSSPPHHAQHNNGLVLGARDLTSSAADSSVLISSKAVRSPTRVGKGSRRIARASFLFQNVRGLKTLASKDLFFQQLSSRNCIAAGLAETWDPQESADYTSPHGLLLVNGSNQRAGCRGSRGVAIALSSAGIAAYNAAGSIIHNLAGGRVIATRLKFKRVCVFFIVGYAPISTSPAKEWAHYYGQVEQMMSLAAPDDIILFAADCNSCIGTSPVLSTTGATTTNRTTTVVPSAFLM